MGKSDVKVQNNKEPEQCSVPDNICVPGEDELSAEKPGGTKNEHYVARNYFESQQFAVTGLLLILKNERNFRFQLGVSVLVVIAGLLLGVSHADWVALFIVIALVLVAEAFNSVIEAVCDTISQDYRINIKYAKDVSAGAVLVSALVSVIAGIIIFFPYVVDLIERLI